MTRTCDNYGHAALGEVTKGVVRAQLGGICNDAYIYRISALTFTHFGGHVVKPPAPRAAAFDGVPRTRLD
jgi:hypothetical protein